MLLLLLLLLLLLFIYLFLERLIREHSFNLPALTRVTPGHPPSPPGCHATLARLAASGEVPPPVIFVPSFLRFSNSFLHNLFILFGWSWSRRLQRHPALQRWRGVTPPGPPTQETRVRPLNKFQSLTAHAADPDSNLIITLTTEGLFQFR